MDVNYLLADEVLNQYHSKTKSFCFLFYIVLSSSCGSLGTISSPNIFGAVAEDETEGISSLGFHHLTDFEG